MPATALYRAVVGTALAVALLLVAIELAVGYGTVARGRQKGAARPTDRVKC
jgi:hypothetical protein